MIELSRALARQFRVVLRSLAEQGSRGSGPVVLCQADEHGLTLQARQGDVAVCHHQVGQRRPGAIAFHASVLAEFESRTDLPVLLEVAPNDKGRTSWSEGGIPRVIEFDLPKKDSLPTLPELPAKLVPMPDDFLQILGEAVRTTAQESTRFGVTRVQMRGKSGELVATDGRQLLIQGGVPLPWKDDLLVARLPVFKIRELALSGSVQLGRTADHLVLRAGEWTFWLSIDKQARYPLWFRGSSEAFEQVGVEQVRSDGP